MKKILSYIFVCLIAITFTRGVFAADFNISCTATTCTPGTITGFFPGTQVWYPTKIFSQSILLNNASGSPQQLFAEPINFTQVEEGNTDLSKVIQFTITRQSDSAIVWDGSLYSFYHSGGVNLLNTLAANTSETFLFQGAMYSTADNPYQNTSTMFDLLITMTTNVTPTPTPQCTVTAPNVPGPLSLSQANSTEVQVTWGAVAGVTGYEISWGTNINANDKGSKSVGLTSETNISGLDLNSNRYYFKVRSVKDCAISDWDGIRSTGNGPDLLAGPTATPTPSGAVLGLLTNQFGQVAGAETNITPSPSVSPGPKTTGNPKVLGASTSQQCHCIWWQLLLGEFIVSCIYFFFIAKDIKQKRHTVIGIIGVALTFALFRILNKCLTFKYVVFANTLSLFCKYFVVADILIMASVMLFKKYRTEKESEPEVPQVIKSSPASVIEN